MSDSDPKSPEVKSDPGFVISTRLDHSVAIGKVSGTIDVEGLKRGAESIWRLPEWPGHAILWDLREAAFNLSHSEIKHFSSFIHRHQPNPPPRRVAFTVKGDLEFGISRVLQAHRERPETEFEVFRDFDVALEWVRNA